MSSSTVDESHARSRRTIAKTTARGLLALSLAVCMPVVQARAQGVDDEVAPEVEVADAGQVTSESAAEPDARVVWTGEIQGKPAKLVMSPKSPTVVGIFLAWSGPVDQTIGSVGGSAVATQDAAAQGGLRSAVNFRIDGGREPLAQLPLPALGRWNVEVVPPVADAAKTFAKPITFVITAGESTVEPPPKRRPIRSFFRQPQVRYTIIGVGCFVAAIIIIVRQYRG